MLYVTTRNSLDTFTVSHTLEHSRGADGGFWIPYRCPAFSGEQIAELKEHSFNRTVADLLNKLFGTNLSSWDVDFCIGRYPVRLKELAGRVVMGEPWHNPQWSFDNMISRLTILLGGTDSAGWPGIAVRTAVLFGIYGELTRQNILVPGERMDISVISGNFLDPMSAWYARNWGLPIGNIICCCNENNSVWNLICQGQMRTDILSIPSILPEADVAVPKELERLIAACAGPDELEDYLHCCRNGRMYVPAPETLASMRQGIYVSVISSHRILQTISGVYASHGYQLAPDGALTYAGLQDYRAKKGQLRVSLVMTGRRPFYSGAIIPTNTE